MNDILPLVLWIATVAMSFWICVVCVLRGALSSDLNKPVASVSWVVVTMQLVSFVLAMSPYLAYKASMTTMSDGCRLFYQRMGIVSAIALFLLIFAELALMYMQGKNATRTSEHAMAARKAAGKKAMKSEEIMECGVSSAKQDDSSSNNQSSN